MEVPSHMETNTRTSPVQEIGVHICPQCRKDIATGLDGRGLPRICNGCRAMSTIPWKRRKPAGSTRRLP